MLVHQLDEDARKCHGVARPPKERKIENIRPPSHSFMKHECLEIWFEIALRLDGNPTLLQAAVNERGTQKKDG